MSAGARTFVPNPVAGPPWGLGLGLGFVAGLPLVLLGAPLALVFADDGDGVAAALAPSMALGAGVGALLALPVWPLGLPFVPDPPPPPPPEPPAQAPRAPGR